MGKRPSNVILYQNKMCPFCGAVRKKLWELNLDFETVELALDDPKIQALGSATVPVIQDGDLTMNESGAIIAYLQKTYGA
jgi:glutathione S-transferase